MSESPHSLEPKFPLSWLVRLLDPVRERVLPFDLDAAMRFAERTTGLDDYGGGGFRWRLEETMQSVGRVDWNALGRFGVRYMLHWQLANRLRLVELLRQRPDIERIPVERPLIITGLFRTGTTYLHNVLAGDPQSRAGRLWELTYPVGRKHDPLGDERWRFVRGRMVVGMDDIMIPDQAEAHRVTVESYEEDFFLLENDMAIFKICVGLGDFDYARRMLGWDMTEPYQWHKRQLQALWAQHSATRWLLKCPWHLWNLDALLRVYPDALIVHTHRDPVEAVGSQCSLSARIASKFRRSLDLDEVGAFWLDYSRAGVDRGLRARAHLAASQVYDVSLSDLRRDPIGAVEAIYRHFGLPLSKASAEAIRHRIAEEPTAQLGPHDYDVRDYGLTYESIRRRFFDYEEHFGLSRPPRGSKAV